MPVPPATLPAAAELVRRSGLVPDRELDRVLAGRPAGPTGLLAALTAAGLLTPFQAGQLAAGRCRGFLLGTNYRILDRLGAGGAGAVYLAEHTVLRRRVAVKVLAATDDPLARERVIREARAAARLDHPNVVHVIDVDPDARPPYLVMEHVDGVTLQAAVAVAGPLRPETAAFCGVQVLGGLQRAHELGLVHRDVKPANVAVDRAGTVKLLDLGLVRTGDALTVLSGTRPVLGTVDYLAPEQARDSSAVDTRADVYGLGGTVFYLLAGRPPFPDGSPGRKLLAKQTADPPPVHTLRPEVPAGLSAVIARMLARDPADRHQTPAAAADALAPFAAPEAGFPARLFGEEPPPAVGTPPPIGRLD
jgi:serine/threonine-protein kinase